MLLSHCIDSLYFPVGPGKYTLIYFLKPFCFSSPYPIIEPVNNVHWFRKHASLGNLSLAILAFQANC